jgi:type IV pilus assembly protein PilC
MPTFAYTARTRTGGQKKGTITADSRQAATVMLTQQGLKIENITERAARGANTAKLNRKVKTADLLVFTRQLSTIVSAGLPLMQGLDILAEQTDDPNFGAIINAISQEVESGETFSDSLRKFPRAFPDLYVSMVRSGEASGDLDGVLIQLAEYLESSEELKRRIKSAMTYPVVAVSKIILIASGLIIWVVPQFAEIFNAMSAGKTPLPAPTRILIAVSDFLRSWYGAPLIVVAIIAAWFSVRAYGATEAGRFQLDAFKLRMPVFGNLSRKVAISRFTRTLSTLTRSGVAILQALEIVERTAGNEVYAKAIRQAADSVRNGDTLADPLARAEVFPAMVTRMIAVGEKTGALEVMLMKISDFYDSEVRALVDSLTSLIEPILIGLMGVVVGGIVIALFMPILQLSSLVSQ